MSVFLDAGRVAPRFSDLGSGRFTTAYGIGLALHTLTSTFTRIELARTADGNSLVLSFGPSF
jgi:hypothetical protein